MKRTATNAKKASSNGAAIFKRMLEDKNAVIAHIQSGGKLSDLKDKLSLVTTASIKGFI
ncbi:MAG: hypothetical protein WDO14_05135 [Bacteroidota bacterium]